MPAPNRAIKHLAQPTDQFSTRDPRRAGWRAAILARLRDRLKITLEAAEPGCPGWRMSKAQCALLKNIIVEVEAMDAN